jgi:hypothetical protein
LNVTDFKGIRAGGQFGRDRLAKQQFASHMLRVTVSVNCSPLQSFVAMPGVTWHTRSIVKRTRIPGNQERNNNSLATGKNDPFFIPAGAEAFRKDIPGAKIQFLDTGHFALETNVVDVASAMKEFLQANGIASSGESKVAR